jgi:hypothetical protein
VSGKEAYVVDNQTVMCVHYGQLNQPQMKLYECQKQEFAWDEPMQTKIITLKFLLFKNEYLQQISLEKMNHTYQIEDTDIIIQTQLQGATRYVLITKKIHYLQNVLERENVQYNFILNLNLNELGVSLIQNFNDSDSKEFIFFSMS